MVPFIYSLSTFGTWFIVPLKLQSHLSSPFSDAATVIISPMGSSLIALTIMVSMIGSINGALVGAVELPQSMAADHLSTLTALLPYCLVALRRLLDS